jgi:O-succinylbenzoic acid--CoA ligase
VADVVAVDAVREALPAALGRALDGVGPCVLPLPEDPRDAGVRERLLAALRPDEPEPTPGAAAIVATSGSTGEPRGAVLTAAAIRAAANGLHERLSGPGQWVLALPAWHVGGLMVLARAHVAGLPAVWADPADARTLEPPPGRAYLSLVPTQLGRALDAGVRLDGYAAVLVGGAACPPALAERARAAGVRVVLSYGMTETCGGCVYDGVPLPGVEVAVGADGRIAVGGATLFAGYRFGAPQHGPHVTGDLGVLDGAGRLTVLGRADDVIVTGGVNVSPQAVEAALAAHPAVREAAVVGAPDPEWGQGVVAYVVLAPSDEPLTLADARAWVAARLGRTAAPREVRVVADLPRLTLGKVDRAALRANLAATPASPTVVVVPPPGFGWGNHHIAGTVGGEAGGSG